MKIPKLVEPYDTSTDIFENFVAQTSRLTTEERAEKLYELRGRAEADPSVISKYVAHGVASLILEARQAAWAVQQRLEGNDEEAIVYVVQPVYNEAERMSPRTKENPHGENALLYRLERLAALHKLCPRLQFHLLVVDDGCDGAGVSSRKSGVVATGLMDDFAAPGVRTEVAYLEDIIHDPDKYGWNPRMKSPIDSIKGGSVIGGFAFCRWLSKRGPVHRSIYVDIDADLSIHPDEIMLLLRKIICEEHVCAVASRRAEGAVAWIDHERDKRGQRYIDAWQSLLPALAKQVTDINRGMKVYADSVIDQIIEQVQERTFVYQVESLNVLAESGYKIAEVPVSYVDSVALSTQVGDEPAQAYDDQMRRISALARRKGVAK